MLKARPKTAFGTNETLFGTIQATYGTVKNDVWYDSSDFRYGQKRRLVLAAATFGTAAALGMHFVANEKCAVENVIVLTQIDTAMQRNTREYDINTNGTGAKPAR